MINIASAAAGIALSNKIKERCIIAAELMEMADLMAVELSYSADNSRKIIRRLGMESSLSHLAFLNDIDMENIRIKTALDAVDNERINLLFNNFGKTDVQSMLEIIGSFKESMRISKERYDAYYQSHSRLFIAFGVLGGLAVSIMLI